MRALNFPAGRGAAAALVLSMLLAGPAVANPERRLEDVRRQRDATAAEERDARERLREARGGLGVVDERRQSALTELRELEARQAELAERLAAVETELEGAQQTLAATERRLADTGAALAEGEERLAETEEELERRRARFSARARAAYKHGGGGYAALALDLSDAAEVGRGIAYMERVIDHDRATVREIADLQHQVEVQVAALEGLRERQAAQRSVAERERDHLAGVLAEQEALTAQVAAETERHRRLVAELDADRASYLVLVDDLEAESAALESELARLGEAQAAAEEEVAQAERERAEAEERAAREARERAEAEERAAREAEEAEARRVAAVEAEEQRQAADGERSARSARSSPSPAPSRSAPSRSPSAGPSPTASPSPTATASPSPSAAPSPAPANEGARLARPVSGPVTSGYGYRTHPIHGDRRLHAGIDFGAPQGTPITAAAGGTVVTAGDRGGYGLTVIVDHGGGLTTLYAHMSRFAVSAGQKVSTGDVLGAVGSTGFSTGPHLHFEVRVNGQPRDPAPYL